ncbi:MULTISPECIES: dTDP-4-dehydrorhamnose reductase [unclassified Rhizobium]|uniref:dTDP-4-dehydrorhamnose reductase n=1 Tax=unclassified Rhizobium TaxID=2613769 RepID=UPI000700A345|nr:MULTISPECIES: dTDP-4-dehydrorhamnose reductase [unclassified Rhizobium]KQV36321.1 dTDP-4-dehydrorhamnose reductase [Rhizobium sp. Root1212]KRD26266.1 dTDP-4-dehydrorhamnose reductase [Rhizobium sp. Root268]
MRIAITGKQGQVVQAMVEQAASLGVELITVGRPEMDLADGSSVSRALLAANPDVIVSAAAYTAVDKAESEPELTFAVNAVGAGAVAQAAAQMGVPLLHLSTDYVFDGSKVAAYVEDDVTGPLSVYGASKLEGERLVADATDNYAILRTAWVYSANGANFMKTMLRLAESRDEVGVVADQFGRPTSAHDIADALIRIALRQKSDPDQRLRGIFHLAADGEASWAEFAREIFKGLEQRTGKSVTVKPISTADYPTPAKRPQNSRLSTDKLSVIYGISLPHWQASTTAVLDRLIGQASKGETE